MLTPQGLRRFQRKAPPDPQTEKHWVLEDKSEPNSGSQEHKQRKEPEGDGIQEGARLHKHEGEEGDTACEQL